jgi:hypothetical protein
MPLREIRAKFKIIAPISELPFRRRVNGVKT